jgi:hypothetical protein
MMNWKICERKTSLLNFKVLSQHFTVQTEDNNEKSVRIISREAEN